MIRLNAVGIRPWIEVVASFGDGSTNNGMAGAGSPSMTLPGCMRKVVDGRGPECVLFPWRIIQSVGPPL